MTIAPITFDKMTTDDGVGECFIFRGAEIIGSLSRERPTKWHGNGVSGLVRDRGAAWVYTADLDGVMVEIPDGSTLRNAKALVKDAAE